MIRPTSLHTRPHIIPDNLPGHRHGISEITRDAAGQSCKHYPDVVTPRPLDRRYPPFRASESESFLGKAPPIGTCPGMAGSHRQGFCLATALQSQYRRFALGQKTGQAVGTIMITMFVTVLLLIFCPGRTALIVTRQFHSFLHRDHTYNRVVSLCRIELEVNVFQIASEPYIGPQVN